MVAIFQFRKARHRQGNPLSGLPAGWDQDAMYQQAVGPGGARLRGPGGRGGGSGGGMRGGAHAQGPSAEEAYRDAIQKLSTVGWGDCTDSLVDRMCSISGVWMLPSLFYMPQDKTIHACNSTHASGLAALQSALLHEAVRI